MESEDIGWKVLKWGMRAGACFVLVALVYLLFIGSRMTPEQRAQKRAEQLAEDQAYYLKMMSGTKVFRQSEGVVYRDPQPLGRGVSLVVVERSGDHFLLNVLVPTSTNLAKGDRIEYNQVIYHSRPGTDDHVNVLR